MKRPDWKKSVKFKWPHLSRDINSSSLKQQVSIAHSQWKWQDETFTCFKHLDNSRGCHTWLMLVKSHRSSWNPPEISEACQNKKRHYMHKQSSWTAVNICNEIFGPEHICWFRMFVSSLWTENEEHDFGLFTAKRISLLKTDLIISKLVIEKLF